MNDIINIKDYLDKRPRGAITSFASQKLSAPLMTRMQAFLTDIFFLLVLRIGVMGAYSDFAKTFFSQYAPEKYDLMIENMVAMEPMIGLVLFYGYFTFFYYVTQGKTPGKAIFKLTVISNDYLEGNLYHKAPTLKEAFFRANGYMMCYATAGLLFLLPFLRKDKRGLQDMVSATSVIDDKQLYQYFITPMRSESEVLEIKCPVVESTKEAA
jgi:uncharacterized RDD family membrane protein YckC